MTTSHRSYTLAWLTLAIITVAAHAAAQPYVVLHDFGHPEGYPPSGPLVQRPSGSFYGITSGHGFFGGGTLFVMTPSGAVTVIYHFMWGGTEPYGPIGEMVLEPDGMLYGTTQYGGAFSCGTIFKWSPPSGSVFTVHSFDCENGQSPEAGLIKGSDGWLYGTTRMSGSGTFGSAFKFNPSTAAFVVLERFAETDKCPCSGLVEATPGVFFGTTLYGGQLVNSEFGGGTVFRVTSAGAFSRVVAFHPSLTPGLGYWPESALVKGADGALYGMTKSASTIYRFTIPPFFLYPWTTLTQVHKFTSADGFGNGGRMLAAQDGSLYGVASPMSLNSDAKLFRVRPQSAPGADYEVLHSIPASAGVPLNQLTQGADGRLYGVTGNNPSYTGGRVYRYDVPPVVELTAANGGERLYTGHSYIVEWKATENRPIASFAVYVSLDGGNTFEPTPICDSISGSERSCTWSVPIATSTGRLKIVATDVDGRMATDVSDADFSVSTDDASLVVTQPNTSAKWATGSVQQITWSHNLGSPAYVRIELTRNANAPTPSWEVLAAHQPSGADLGVFNWFVTGPLTTAARVRISWVNGPTVADQSDVNFSIAAPRVTVTSPNTNVNWGAGTTHRIAWTDNFGSFGRVRIEVSADGGASWSLVNASVQNSSATGGQYDWLIPATFPFTTAARIRLTWTADASVIDVNNANFRIQPAAILSVTSPTGASIWPSGSTQTVSWTSNLGIGDTVGVWLSTDGGVTYPTLLGSGIPATDGTVTVTAPNVTTATARVRLVWVNGVLSSTKDSPGFFDIQ
jgi:uncharacterized repeat protein (TIGR03803 family)